MLDPIDFNGIYIQQLQNRQGEPGFAEAPAGEA
jgi:preprotein translocase subunit SecB